MTDFTAPFFVFVVGLLWALILDGVFVERGRGYIKIKYFVKKNWQITKAWKGFVAYIIEIAIIAFFISWFSKETIPSFLSTNPVLTLIISILVGYGRFRKDIYGHWFLG